MNQRGGDAKRNLEKEKNEVLSIIKKTPSLPVYFLSALPIIRGYGKVNAQGDLDKLRKYKQDLLDYFKSKYPNQNYNTLNDYFIYEAEKRAKKIGGKRKTRRGKKSRGITRKKK